MAKSNDPMERKTQAKEVAGTLKDLREIQEEPSPIKSVALGKKKRKKKA